jgi:predicted nucleotidyltransferase
MESDNGFRSFSRAIETEPIGLLLAKWRRDVFIRKLMKLPDVIDVIPSGSLARGTQIGPVHDVDLIVVFDKAQHPDYGIKGKTKEAEESARAALTHLEAELLEQLHPWRGAAGGLLKESEQRTHVVKYNGDWAGPFEGFIPSAPPVDVMPAVREGSHLLIPERGTGWIEADPEWLIRQVEQRQREWKYFTEVVGMVKAWARLNHLKMKNLAVEVMVLEYCPSPRLFETLSVGEAVARFFEAAAKAKITILEDPAKLCGKIDPGMNYGKLHSALSEAAVLARKAMDAERVWENPQFAAGEIFHPDVFWRKLFGKKYPRTNERFWLAPVTEPWFYRWAKGPAEAGGPNHPDNPAPKGPDAGPHGPNDGPNGGGPNGPNGGGPSGGPNGPNGGGPSGPGGGAPGGPDRDPGHPRPRPHGPGDGPARPTGPRGPRRRPAPASAERGADFWTSVLGPAVGATSVPLTYG